MREVILHDEGIIQPQDFDKKMRGMKCILGIIIYEINIRCSASVDTGIKECLSTILTINQNVRSLNVRYFNTAMLE